MIVISNTTPLIGMAVIGQFDLLHRLFGKIYIPQAVYDEAMVAGREEGGARLEVTEASWIETVRVIDRLAVDVLLDELDLGEAETIVLARQMQADWVLMDEKKGRRKLAELELNKIGTLGLLLRAKQNGWLSVLAPELEKLQQLGFSLSQEVVNAILRQAGER